LPGDLAAYLAGTASPRVLQHLARCAHCAAEAQALARLERELRSAWYRAACPSPEMLLRYQTGMLRAAERRAIDRHVAQCAACAREVQQFTAHAAPQRSVWDRLDDSLRAVVEALRVSPLQQTSPALRGQLLQPVLFQAGDLHLVLRSEPPVSAADGWTLRGRVTRLGQAAPELQERPVRLSAQGALAAETSVDELGYFVFSTLAAGRYDLWLEQPAHDVIVRDVLIGSQAG
jgi:hypothetical protein